MNAALFFGFAAMVLVVLAVSLATGTFVRAARRRAKDLEHADRALRAHYDALAAVLDCDDVSERMKTALYSFHQSVIRRDSAMTVAASLMSPSEAAEVEVDDEFEAEYQAIQAKNPNVFQAMHTAIHSGIVMLMLRWPETAKQFRRLSVEVAIDAKKERTIRHELIQKGRHHSDDGGPMDGGLIAA